MAEQETDPPDPELVRRMNEPASRLELIRETTDIVEAINNIQQSLVLIVNKDYEGAGKAIGVTQVSVTKLLDRLKLKLAIEPHE